MARAELLASTKITLKFYPQITCFLESLTKEMAAWLKDPSSSNTSKVGSLSSPQFQALVQPSRSFGDEASINFQCMISAASLAHTQQNLPHARLNDDSSESTKLPERSKQGNNPIIMELQQIGAFAGHQFLIFLDKKLTPQSLATLSKEDLQALFLIIMGTILAIGYAQPMKEFPPFPPKEVRFTPQPRCCDLQTIQDNYPQNPETLYDAMQKHLCRTLAHYAIFIGSKLGLPFVGHVERFIIEAAHARWNREGRFSWLTKETLPENDETGHELEAKWPVFLTDFYSANGGFSFEDSGPYSQASNRIFFPPSYSTISIRTVARDRTVVCPHRRNHGLVGRSGTTF
jgi:hypothetical protein